MFDLPVGQLRQLVRHALDCLPEECCGVLIGLKTESGRSRVHRAIAADNVSTDDRERRYVVDPLAVLEADRGARAEGLELVGYYHSHPSGAATPSASDRRGAWPDTSYVILGMDGGELREVRSWRLGSGDAGLLEEALYCGDMKK